MLNVNLHSAFLLSGTCYNYIECNYGECKYVKYHYNKCSGVCIIVTCKVWRVKNAFPHTSQTWDRPSVGVFDPFEGSDADTDPGSASPCPDCDPVSPTPCRRRSCVRRELRRCLKTFFRLLIINVCREHRYTIIDRLLICTARLPYFG